MELLPFLANAGSAGDIHPALILPFGLLLLLIAVMPLTSARLKHLWERYHPHAALALAALVGAFYLVCMPDGAATLGHTAHEYFSFIALVGSLFVVAGGIHLRVKGEATPRDNVVLLLVGAVLANFIGTTGASMVLIRPYIRMNKVRSAPTMWCFLSLSFRIAAARSPRSGIRPCFWATCAACRFSG